MRIAINEWHDDDCETGVGVDISSQGESRVYVRERWVATYTTRREAERHAARIRKALKGERE